MARTRSVAARRLALLGGVLVLASSPDGPAQKLPVPTPPAARAVAVATPMPSGGVTLTTSALAMTGLALTQTTEPIAMTGLALSATTDPLVMTGKAPQVPAVKPVTASTAAPR